MQALERRERGNLDQPARTRRAGGSAEYELVQLLQRLNAIERGELGSPGDLERAHTCRQNRTLAQVGEGPSEYDESGLVGLRGDAGQVARIRAGQRVAVRVEGRV